MSVEFLSNKDISSRTLSVLLRASSIQVNRISASTAFTHFTPFTPPELV